MGDRGDDGHSDVRPTSTTALLTLALDPIAAPCRSESGDRGGALLALTSVPAERARVNRALEGTVNIAASCRLPDCFETFKRQPVSWFLQGSIVGAS